MALRQPYAPPILGSVAIATNPSSGTVMADTGAVGHDGNYEIRIILSQSAAAVYSLARRNLANGADISPTPIVLYGAAGQSSQYALMVPLLTGERVRVTMGASLTGQSQVAIQAECMA
jgi:hypothetical protein